MMSNFDDGQSTLKTKNVKTVHETQVATPAPSLLNMAYAKYHGYHYMHL